MKLQTLKLRYSVSAFTNPSKPSSSLGTPVYHRKGIKTSMQRIKKKSFFLFVFQPEMFIDAYFYHISDR